MPTRAQLLAYAPGCGSPTPVVGTGGVAPCGATVSGKLHLCHYCQPQQEGRAKAFLKTLSDEPRPVKDWVPGTSYDYPWEWLGRRYGVQFQNGKMHIGGGEIEPTTAGHILRRMVKKLKPNRVSVNPGVWLDTANRLLPLSSVSGVCYTFDVPRWMFEGTAKTFLRSVKPAGIFGKMRVTVGGRHPSFTNVRAIWYRDLLRVGTNKHPGLTLERGNPPPHHVTPEDWERMLDLVEKHVNEDGETAGEYEEMNPEEWTGHNTLPYVAWEYDGGPDKFDYDYQHAALAPSCE
jgi:hypothetical protein